MGKFSNDVYFASYDPGDPRYLDALIDKVSIYRRFLTSSGKMSLWQKAMKNYYGLSSDGGKSSSSVMRGGTQGQRIMAKVNDYRNLIQHQLILVTSQRPAGEAKAINSDPDSLKQARIASQLIEYYLSQVGFEQKFVTNAELALTVDEGFAVIDWDATAGDPIRPKVDEFGNPTSEMEMTGDMTLRPISPWNMARDPYLSSPSDMKWGIYSYRVNKFDLAAKFPNKEDAILKGTSRQLRELAFNPLSDNDSDQIEIFVLSHSPSPSCPQGRLTQFVTEDILLDGPFPYSEFNIYRMSQNDVADSCFGYTNNNDLLALEEVTDAFHSVLITNNVTYGAQCIIAPKNANLEHIKIADGCAYFEVEAALVDKVRPLQLTKSAPEMYQYLEVLSRKKETLAGINSVVRGDPEGALRSNSGSALALVQAQSIQFNSGGQRSYYHLLAKCCTGMILMLQKFAHNERIVRITGKVQGQYLEEFKYSANDLNKISAVTFEITNPLEQTIGAKDARAQDLLKAGLITDARNYLLVSRTGNIDTIIEDDEAFALAIKSENELLREGQPVQVIVSENHEKHMEGHSAVIASPEAKKNHALVRAVLQHNDAHLKIWQNLSQNNPALLIATHQKVLPPPPPPPGLGPPGPPPMPMAQGGPPNPNGPPQGPQVMNAQSPAEHIAGNIRPANMPKMPMNPLTHQRAPGPLGP